MSEICGKLNNFNNVNSDVDKVNIENVDILGVFENIYQSVNSDICDLELCELTILQNFRLMGKSLPQFLDEVNLEK
ncbi:MAG: hypothetical protein Q4P14_04090 [Methanobacteriaceae archaeon]|nr:hypothetical protein [Methanobacteriaceae archaeon]